ncbi:glycerophosphoryl diester phosphodiesterase [Agaricicola taiwanensis]|uniref:Glycerophosphoryl diester phosphodiesterase n=1 Tax=Agaricicola taiwanensis TaxID=591372 RepID=A0A8J2YJK8_9RHOB|nr:glycerophosphodiester phosphodiesterase family protein [Agaricicola taiwanensis]GGE47292.1 glycerophosphoryl diester phosphodiesterase [Agaricicola taiwanensis]
MKGPGRLDWLVARPIAHRGLHDRAAGVIENSATAVAHAVNLGFAVEVDVQLTADGSAVVFHDDMLNRLTAYKGLVVERSEEELLSMPLLDSAAGDLIWTLEQCLTLVAGRVPVVVEIKSAWNGDTRLAERVGRSLAAYSGPRAAKSFDPTMVQALYRAAPSVPRGIIGCAYTTADWPFLSWQQRWRLRHMIHWPQTRPDFVSWKVDDLPSPAVSVARRVIGAPVMTWTVRTPEQQARAGLYADQMVFEGFVP